MIVQMEIVIAIVHCEKHPTNMWPNEGSVRGVAMHFEEINLVLVLSFRWRDNLDLMNNCQD